ncbi:MAG: adenosylhomocysteinase [Planctomycetota bacterium]|nr:MAG: adenosylhomocysteinase [Planctomycetota bacterium]
MDHHVKDLSLADEGKRRILWADRDMQVLARIRERFERERPLEGVTMACCLHVTAETANLVRTLKAGGADVCLCASNPLSTQDDVAASLVRDFGIPTFAVRGEDNDTYYAHIEECIARKPRITMDDGADLVSTILKDHPDVLENLYGSTEETTTGVIRLRAMERDGALGVPVIAVNDAQTKYMFDNRYGTGQSTVDGIIRATDILLAGKNVVVAGYGWCGRGFAMRARGMGANVIVTEVNPIRALEAVMDGFRVMPMEEAAPIGDLFCTLTGNIAVIRREHFERMKDGAIVCNSGHFDVEIRVGDLEDLAVKVNRGVRREVDEYVMADGRRIRLLAQGRLINLSAAEGHPASVMDMSFSLQALSSEYVAKNRGALAAGVHPVPEEIDRRVAELKLEAVRVGIDRLTAEQKDYLSRWDMGT